MNLFLSILYAPVIFYSLKNFDLKIVSIVIFIVTLLWFVIVLKKGIREFIFPLFYMLLSSFAYFMNDYIFLKALPLFISIIISIYMFYSYFTKNSFIFILLEKIGKYIDENEKIYINKATLFWALSSSINIFVHIYILSIQNEYYWMIYSSVGWYVIFITAGIIQFIHKRLYFNKDRH